MISDQLLESLKKGDAAAYKQFVDQYTPWMTNVARHFKCKPEDVEDAVQETLVTMVEKLNDLNENSNLKSWLYVVIRSKVVNHYRKTKRVVLFRTNDSIDKADDKTNLDDLISDQQVVREEIGKLREREQKILHCYMMGYTTEESSKETGIKPASYGVYLFRAKAKLRKRLEARILNNDL